MNVERDNTVESGFTVEIHVESEITVLLGTQMLSLKDVIECGNTFPQPFTHIKI